MVSYIKKNFEIFFEKKWFVFCWLFFLAFVSYFSTLGIPFFGDDTYRVGHSSNVESLLVALGGELRDRPLLMFSIWIDKVCFSLNPFFLRLENVFLSSLVGFELFIFVQYLFSIIKRDLSKITLLLLVSLFVLHPLHNQTINLVIQRGVLFSALFGLLSMKFFFSYFKENKCEHLFFSILFFALTLLSKPNAIFLPAFYFLALRFFFKDEFKRKGSALGFYLPPLLLPVVFYFVLKVNDQSSSLTLDPLSYFLVETRVLFTYFKLMVFPYGLKYLYDFSPPVNLVFNVYWGFLFIHLLIIGGALKLIRDRFLLLWFLGFYLSFTPESSIFPIIYPVFEHRCYIPLIFLFIFFALVLTKVKPDKEKKLWVAMSVLLVLYFGLNQIRNRQIQTLDSWRLHCIQNSYSWHKHNFLYSVELLKSGRQKELEPIIQKYRNLYPNSVLYKILFEIEAYYKENYATKRIKNISDYLLQYELPAPQREAVNWFLLQALGKTEALTTDLLLLENILSLQMKIFKNEPKEFGYVLNGYQTLALRLLANPELKRVNHLQYLKIKVILYYYFSRKDENLNFEVLKAFKQNPRSPILKRLREMML